MIPHELAHGVVAHADGVDLKSTGLVFFAIFFGAFVEPDEEDILDSKPETKMRTFAAGIFPNLLLALLTIPFLVFQTQILSPLYYPPDGVLIFETVPNSPAEESGLARGIAILDINGTHIDSPTTFTQVMNATQPNQTLLLNTTKGEYTVILATNPSNNATGFLGVQTIPYFPPKYSWAAVFFPYFYSQEVMWTLVISFGAVALNSLPIPIIVDGDKLLSTFLTRYIKNERLALIILDIFRFLALSLFLASLILPLVRNGFTRII
jgi:membrane-associated protease RseP (regulator of RpoE activity)